MNNYGNSLGFIAKSSNHKILGKIITSNHIESEENNYQPLQILKDYENKTSKFKKNNNNKIVLYDENFLNDSKSSTIPKEFDNFEEDNILTCKYNHEEKNFEHNKEKLTDEGNYHKENSSNKLKELFKDYNYKISNLDKKIPIHSSEEEEKFIKALELKKKVLNEINKNRKEKQSQLIYSSTYVVKPKTQKQLDKILKSKKKRIEKLKQNRKNKQKKKEAKNENIFLHPEKNRNIKDDTKTEFNFKNWTSLLDWELREKFKNRGFDLNLVNFEISKLIKNYFFSEFLKEEIYFSSLNKLENFSGEEYNDLLVKKNTILSSEDKFDEKDVNYLNFYNMNSRL